MKNQYGIEHMKKILVVTILALAVFFSGWFPKMKAVHAQVPVVYAVLFYSPSCPHCHKVINEDLPPLWEKYGESLQVLGINVSVEDGQKLYQAAIQAFNIPEDRRGVPALIVGQTVLVGSLEIPETFPKIIEEGLAAGGIPWPQIPGLQEALAATEEDTTTQGQPQDSDAAAENSPNAAPAGSYETEPLTSTTGSESIAEEINIDSLSPLERFALDPAGNTLAVIVLIGMMITVVIALFRFQGVTGNSSELSKWVPGLALVGLGIAVYLAYVELTHTSAVCGPVGDCNTVQTSPYAYLFGLLPIGVLGAAGYVAILGAWFLGTFGSEQWKRPAALAIWGMALFGTIFSIYLTFLEPFVIGATCAWCVTSAVLMTLILWVSTPTAQSARKKTRRSSAKGLAA